MRTSQFRQPSGSDEETGRDHAHPQPHGLWGPSRSDGQPPAPRLRSAGPAPFLAEQYASYPASQEKQKFGIQGVPAQQRGMNLCRPAIDRKRDDYWIAASSLIRASHLLPRYSARTPHPLPLLPQGEKGFTFVALIKYRDRLLRRRRHQIPSCRRSLATKAVPQESLAVVGASASSTRQNGVMSASALPCLCASSAASATVRR